MPGKRPTTGPVIREDIGDSDMSETATLGRRWKYLQDGAELGGLLCDASRQGSLEDVAGALRTMSRNQLEAACMALVVVHTSGTSLDSDA